MIRHTFVDESVRGASYIMCATSIRADGLDAARKTLRSLAAPGQRRTHFATESDGRRRDLLRAMSHLKTLSVVYVAHHPDQVKARAAILAAMVPKLQNSDVRHLVLESRQEQDKRDRSAIYHSVGPHPTRPFSYSHCPAPSEPLLWVADAVAWAWGRGGRWRTMIADLHLLVAVEEIQVP